MSVPLPIGAKRLNHNGYVLIKTADGWRFEHRVVWESVNGPLGPEDVIHHINHDRTDNRIDNLKACSNSEHISEHHSDRMRVWSRINAEKWRGKSRTPEQKARIRASVIGKKKKPRTKEHTAIASAAMRRLWQSPEYRAKMRVSRSGKPLSPERREKLMAAVRGVPKTPEHRAKLSAAMRNFIKRSAPSLPLPLATEKRS